MKVKSDPTLLADVRRYGNFDINACYQCGSCTIKCELTNDLAPFPRRTIRYALLGLRKPLLNSLEPWLCYYCGDCSEACPRQTEPGEAMMTLRRYLTSQYDWTGIASRICRSTKWRLGSLFAVGFLVLILIVLYHLYSVGIELSDFITVSMGMEHMFGNIEIFTLSVFAISLFLLLSNALRMYWYTMHSGNKIKIPISLYLTQAWRMILHTLTQRRFRDCTDKSRWIIHWLLASGCVLMFIILVFFLKWFQTDNIYPVYHPQRWLGYLITGALVFATAEIFFGRIKKQEQVHKFSDLSDWVLPILLLMTALSGLAVHISRYSGFPLLTIYLYTLHLVIAVPMLIVEIPFGKWSHMIYRPLAIYFQTVKDKTLLREQKLSQKLPGEVVAEHAG